jgi:hypothetical protein
MYCMPVEPTGARISGRSALSPRIVVDRSRLEMSTRIFWRSLIFSMSARLARSVSSAYEPWST